MFTASRSPKRSRKNRTSQPTISTIIPTSRITTASVLDTSRPYALAITRGPPASTRRCLRVAAFEDDGAGDERDEGVEGEQEDPRRELVERLLEHERFKNAAQMLMQKQQIEAATWSNPAIRQFRLEGEEDQEIAADTVDLVRVFREILDRARQRPVLDVDEDAVTVSQMLDYVRRRLIMEERPVSLSSLLRNTRSERALVCMFLALLEMVRLQAILLRQDSNFGEVYIKKHPEFEQVMNQGLLQANDDWR